MNFSTVFMKMVELFLIIIIGYIACKANVIDKEGKKKLTKIVLNVTLPATIFSAVMSQENIPEVSVIINLLLCAICSYVILFAGAFIFPRLIGVSKSQMGIYQFVLVFGNVGFIGYPVTQAIFGNSALFYTCVFNLPFNLLVYSIGVVLIKKNAAYNLSENNEVNDTVESKKAANDVNKESFNILELKKLLLTPCMISSIISIIMAFAHWRGPVVLADTFEIVSGITTPAALLIIGASLAEIEAGQMFSNIRVYLISMVRLIVVPVIMYYIFKIFVTDTLLLGVAVVIAAMPVATNGTMLCFEYGGDEKLMSQATFITTLMSVFTIPLISMFLL